MEVKTAEKKLWLIKVPKHVAQQWQVASQRAASGAQSVGPELGRIRITSGAAQAEPDFQFTLANAQQAGLPREYTMRAQSGSVAAMHLLAERQGCTSLEGRVDQKFDLELRSAANDAAGEGEVVIDPEYRRLSRERHQAAATKTRLMRVIEDPRSATFARNPAPVKIQIGKRKEALPSGSRRKSPPEKRVRMERDALEGLLFRLFERQANWNFAQLHKETDQPAAWLKEVLLSIASFKKGGPTQQHWQLKPEYRTGAG
ncbi:hypothetical protein WJX81_008134 [Elliptochloris bilobata]|uniref:Transcription initiation factor IIF subunit beta n=1 Tax=Elliptochloris bilobata TaxID=381761 RepID=A0AAW1R0Z0_9CHLO